MVKDNFMKSKTMFSRYYNIRVLIKIIFEMGLELHIIRMEIF